MRLDTQVEPPPDRRKCTGPPVRSGDRRPKADVRSGSSAREPAPASKGRSSPEPPGSSGSPAGKPGTAHRAPRYPIAALAKLGRTPERSVLR